MATIRAVPLRPLSTACPHVRVAPRLHPKQAREPRTAREVRPEPATPLVPAQRQVRTARPAPSSAAPTRATPARALPARRSNQRSLEKVIISYFGPIVDRSECGLRIRSVAALAECRDESRDAADGTRTRRWTMSGDGRSASLKGGARRIQIDRRDVGDQMRECSGLEPRQTGRCRDRHRVGQRQYGADCAFIG